METSASEAYKTTVLRNFIAKDGTLRSIPAQYKKKLVILEYLVGGLKREGISGKGYQCVYQALLCGLCDHSAGIYHSSIYEP